MPIHFRTLRVVICDWCSSSHDDAAVRVKLLGLLTSSPSNCHQWQQLGHDIVTKLVSCHREMLGRQGRCYSNSVHHRRSHRIMTAIILLEHYTRVCTVIAFAVDILQWFCVVEDCRHTNQEAGGL